MSTEAETTSATATVTTPTKTAPTGTPTGTPSKETDEARSQLVQGRRHLLVKDYFSAVAALAKGCELLAQKFGDTAPELGDAYLTYGRALLELARSESGVLGMNEDGEADGEGEEDDEEGEGEEEEGEDEEENAKEENGKEEDGDAKVENGKEEDGDAKEKNGKEEEGDAKDENGKEEAGKGKVENGVAKTENGQEENGEEGEAAATSDEAAASTSNGKAESNGTEANGEEEEDVNNLQLAWEILELAKTIFQKQLETEGEAAEKPTSLKLAEVHLKLGEVGVESENYSTAVEDMKACLALQRKYLDEDDRRIAETLFNLGTAYSLANEFDAAIEQFKAAAEQIEKRIASLEKRKAEPEPTPEEKAASDDPFYTVQGEIDELKALLPEIKEKVSDMQDFKKETVRRMMEGLAEASAKQSSTADGAGPSSASDKPVSSVAHLVKRKPKEEVKEETPVEKTAEKMEVEQKDEVKEETPVEKTAEKMEVEQKDEVKEEAETAVERKRKPEDAIDSEDGSKKVKVDSEEAKVAE